MMDRDSLIGEPFFLKSKSSFLAFNYLEFLTNLFEKNICLVDKKKVGGKLKRKIAIKNID